MRTTFNNLKGDEEAYKKAIRNLESVTRDMEFYMKFGDQSDKSDFIEELPNHCGTIDEVIEACEQFQSLGPFSEYGLCFDYVHSKTFNDQEEGYFRYQFSWGGPSTELRLYKDWAEFVYMDWFSGIGFDVSTEDWVEWIKDYMTDIGMLDWDMAQEQEETYGYDSEDVDEN